MPVAVAIAARLVGVGGFASVKVMVDVGVGDSVGAESRVVERTVATRVAISS